VRRENVGLGPFLEALEQRLDALSAGQLREILVGHATRLPADERAGFLALFDPPPRTEGSLTSGTGEAGDSGLLADVESFVADIAAGVYVDGWGYDPDYRDHRAFGDETWTYSLDRLLDRAGLALLAGDAATAREAYLELFAAMQAEHGEAGFPGAGTPEESIATDMGEAKHRYLRAVWDSEPAATRAAAVLAVAEDIAYLGGTPSLVALEATRREPLPDLDAVLPDLPGWRQFRPASGSGRRLDGCWPRQPNGGAASMGSPSSPAPPATSRPTPTATGSTRWCAPVGSAMPGTPRPRRSTASSRRDA
jgi:hypothetical protein